MARPAGRVGHQPPRWPRRHVGAVDTQLLGERNWWIPDWLERILPRLDVERVAVGEGSP
jgi:hypothetical protein